MFFEVVMNICMKKFMVLTAALMIGTSCLAMDPPPIVAEEPLDTPPTSPRAFKAELPPGPEPVQDQQPTPTHLVQDFTEVPDVNKRILSFVGEVSDLVHVSSTCQYFHSFLNEIIQNKVLLVGSPGNGKSALAHLFVGQPLITNPWHTLIAEEKLPNINIKAGWKRGTWEHNAVIDYSHKRLIIDSPGFEEHDYDNAEKFYTLLTGTGNVSVVLVASDAYMDGQFGKPFALMINKLTEIFPEPSELKKVLSLVVSKEPTESSFQNLRKWIQLRPHYLTDQGHELLKFFMETPSHLASFTSPSQEGLYIIPENLKTFMGNLQYVANPEVTPPLWGSIMSNDKQGRWSSKGSYNPDGTQQ